MPDELGPSPHLFNDGSATMPLTNWDGEREKRRDKRVRRTTRGKRSDDTAPSRWATAMVSDGEPAREKKKRGKLVEREMSVESKLPWVPIR